LYYYNSKYGIYNTTSPIKTATNIA
jgi:hypothetical protein